MLVRINYAVTTVIDSYTALPSELRLNTFVRDLLNRVLQLCTVTQLWLAVADRLRRACSQWHYGLWGVRSFMEAVTEQLTGCPIASSSLDSCDVESEMTFRIMCISTNGQIQWDNLFLSSPHHLTSCNFCVIFVNHWNSSMKTTAHLLLC